MGRKPRCPICHSKKWHRDALSGSVVCEDGHLLQGYMQESTESQEASNFLTTTRRIRKNNARKVKVPKNAHLHGERAQFLLAQALQLVLRHQLHVLVDQLGFPSDLESVCRDLWAMLIASSDLAAAPADHERGDEPASSYSGPREGARYHRTGRKRRKPNGKAGDGDDDDEGDIEEENEKDRAKRGGERSSGDEDDDDESEEEEEGGPLDPDQEPKPPLVPNPPGRRSAAASSKPHATSEPRDRLRIDFLLIIIYLGCVTLRLPVLLKDILDLAETYRIPYLNARLNLPLEMQLHLDLASAHILNPSTVPRVGAHPSGIQTWLSRLVRVYRDDWGVRFPEANLPVLSWRLCRSLALPPLLYTALKRLLSLLPPFSFDLPVHRARTEPRANLPVEQLSFLDLEEREEGYEWPKNGDGRGNLPEVMLVAGLVVLVRQVYAHEGTKRDTSTAKDIRAHLPDTAAWVRALADLAQLVPGCETTRVFSKEVASLADDDIDAYLSFFESNIVPSFPDKQRMADIDRHFPAPRDSSLPTPPPPSQPLTTQVDDLLSALYSSPSSPTPPISTPPSAFLAQFTASAAALVGLRASELSPVVGTGRAHLSS
ncbi:hypothetical protein RQP46_002847 [Phenoliferia psychrophenolica]